MHKSFVALLVKEVKLPNMEMLPIDTTISVDVEDGIALWEDEHFDIFRDEYILLN